MLLASFDFYSSSTLWNSACSAKRLARHWTATRHRCIHWSLSGMHDSQRVYAACMLNDDGGHLQYIHLYAPWRKVAINEKKIIINSTINRM